MPSPWRWLVVLAVLASVSLAAPPKKSKKAPRPPPAVVTELEVRLVLDGGQERVGACVLEGADDGPLHQVVLVKVTLNGVGQVMGAKVKLDPENAQATKTSECVEAVVRGLTYPKSGAPLITVEREWTFKAE